MALGAAFTQKGAGVLETPEGNGSDVHAAFARNEHRLLKAALLLKQEMQDHADAVKLAVVEYVVLIRDQDRLGVYADGDVLKTEGRQFFCQLQRVRRCDGCGAGQGFCFRRCADGCCSRFGFCHIGGPGGRFGLFFIQARRPGLVSFAQVELQAEAEFVVLFGGVEVAFGIEGEGKGVEIVSRGVKPQTQMGVDAVVFGQQVEPVVGFELHAAEDAVEPVGPETVAQAGAKTPELLAQDGIPGLKIVGLSPEILKAEGELGQVVAVERQLNFQAAREISSSTIGRVLSDPAGHFEIGQKAERQEIVLYIIGIIVRVRVGTAVMLVRKEKFPPAVFHHFGIGRVDDAAVALQ